MTKKDYQAIALAINEAIEEARKDPLGVAADGGLPNRMIAKLTGALAAENPRFDRALFLAACETGTCKGMAKGKGA
jgi:hypothetical protein